MSYQRVPQEPYPPPGYAPSPPNYPSPPPPPPPPPYEGYPPPPPPGYPPPPPPGYPPPPRPGYQDYFNGGYPPPPPPQQYQSQDDHSGCASFLQGWYAISISVLLGSFSPLLQIIRFNVLRTFGAYVCCFSY